MAVRHANHYTKQVVLHQRKQRNTVSQKDMASVLWDAEGIVLIDYHPICQTIAGQYYANLLDQLLQKICAERPALARKKVLFHQNNALLHTCIIAMAKIHKLR